MWRFAEWLLTEERSLVDPSVLDSYERAFQERLEDLIRHTRAPDLRQAFEDMRRCPIKSMNGKCSRFVDYIIAALVKQGCHHQYDVEGSLQRIIFKMLGDKGERGLPHKGVFDFDETRPYNLRLGNPVQVIFKKFLANELRSISMGCIPWIRTLQRPGRLSIGQGNEDAGTVSADDIPDRPQSHDPELTNDLIELLRKQSTPNLHLVDLFHSILDGEGPGELSRRFRGADIDTGRRMIVKAIEQYANSSQNWRNASTAGSLPRRYPKSLNHQQIDAQIASCRRQPGLN